MKAPAEPTKEAMAEMKNPFIPYAKPQREVSVVWPTNGGIEMMPIPQSETGCPKSEKWSNEQMAMPRVSHPQRVSERSLALS
jgi:hypothetical protein